LSPPLCLNTPPVFSFCFPHNLPSSADTCAKFLCSFRIPFLETFPPTPLGPRCAYRLPFLVFPPLPATLTSVTPLNVSAGLSRLAPRGMDLTSPPVLPGFRSMVPSSFSETSSLLILTCFFCRSLFRDQLFFSFPPSPLSQD